MTRTTYFADLMYLMSNETLREIADGKNAYRAMVAKRILSERDFAVTIAS